MNKTRNLALPTFDDVLQELHAMQERKGQDYGKGQDLLFNLRRSADFGIPPWVGTILRANDKMSRISTFICTGKLINEKVEDSLIDLAVYAIHALRLYRESVNETFNTGDKK
jgi:hypothetical protein